LPKRGAATTANPSITVRNGNEGDLVVAKGKRIAALIVAAGEGHRLGMSQPKAFVALGDEPILAHTLRPFEACRRIQSLHLVLREQDIESWHEEILVRYAFRKSKPPVAGGARRQDSVRLGLETVEEGTDVVLIHDGARPFVDGAMLDRLLDALEEVPAVVVAVPTKETVKVVSSGGLIVETPARDRLWTVQTPQAFEFHTILKAHRKALDEGITATDDSTLVERLGVPVRVVHGSYRNIKITTPEDLRVAQAFLEDRKTAES
jgi:2-C-methyl-D-erythritol 4-phosphate cytidylyltransferase